MTQFTRRRFLQSAAAAAAATALPPSLLCAADATAAPARKLNVVMVGMGMRGAGLLNEVAASPGAHIAALVDVDSNTLAASNKKFPNATPFADFRDAIRHPDVDAVVVATPDHTHAVIAAAAMRAGKHVYCEKPLAHTLKETRVLTQLASDTKRVTQLGIQIHSLDNYRRVVELIRAGAVGPVREVHIWTTRGSHSAAGQLADPPASLNYDLWLGPAQHRPYHTAFHPIAWRRFWTFGEGMMGDIGCHFMDLPFWALGLRHPTRVAATSPESPTPDDDITPEALVVRYEFPATEFAPKPLPLTWYDPPHRPEAFASWNLPQNLTSEGIMFVGERGLLCSSYSEHALLPADQFKTYQRPPQSIPSSPGHAAEWVKACLANDPAATTCPFSYGGPLSEAALLGPIAYRAGKPLDWDHANLRFTNDDAANRHVHYPYRDGWSL